MNCCTMDRLSATEFGTTLKKMKQTERNDFVLLNRDEILLIDDVDKLRILCDYGYMMALIPMLGNVSDEEILDWYKRLYPRTFRNHLTLALTLQEEYILLQYAGQHLEIAKHLNENTELFFDHNQKTVPYRKILYSTASEGVFEYLFRYLIDKRIAMNITCADIFFKRASKDLIEDYSRRLGQFSGKNSFNSKMAHILYEREDLSQDEKNEIFWIIMKYFNVKDSARYQLKKDGFIH